MEQNLDEILSTSNQNNQSATATTNTMTTASGSTSLSFSPKNVIPQSTTIPLYSLNNFNTNLQTYCYSKMYCPRKRNIAPNCRMRPYYIPSEKRIRTKSENNVEGASGSNSLYLETISIINSIGAGTGAMMIDSSSNTNDQMEDVLYFSTQPNSTNVVSSHSTQPTTKTQPLLMLKRAKSLETIKFGPENVTRIDGTTEKNFHEMEFVLTSRIQKMKVQE